MAGEATAEEITIVKMGYEVPTVILVTAIETKGHLDTEEEEAARF